jgi:sugar phosphate permease
MPFRLARAPRTYQRFVSFVRVPIKRTWLQVYIDDILNFSKDSDEHLAHVIEVMAILAIIFFTFDLTSVNRLGNPWSL